MSNSSEAFTQAGSESISVLAKQRSRTSWIWQHMDGGADTVLKMGNDIYWRCMHCLAKYKYTGGTQTIASHLNRRHGKKDPKALTDGTVGAVGQHIELAFARSLLNSHKRRKVINGGDSFDPRVFEELLIEWIAVNSVSFKSCESTQFKALLVYLNENANNVLPTRNTLRTWSIQQYHTRQKTLLLELSLVTQKIHLSIDLWSGGGFAYIGVIAHYFDQHSQPKAPVLIFCEMKGSHTGENQAGYVMKAIVDFGITSKLGYFMLDNASNNDTLMSHLQKGRLI